MNGMPASRGRDAQYTGAHYAPGFAVLAFLPRPTGRHHAPIALLKDALIRTAQAAESFGARALLVHNGMAGFSHREELATTHALLSTDREWAGNYSCID